MLFATTAHAESTKLFPLAAGNLPRTFRTAPAELTRVLAKSLDVEAAIAPIDDAAQMLDCDVMSRSCLEAIARTSKVDKIIFGRVDARDDGVIVKLTTFDAGSGVQNRKYDIDGETVDALVEALTAQLANKPTRKAQRIDKPIEPTDPPVQPTTEPAQPAATGKITTGTWGLIIGGAIATGAGGVFMLSANSLRGDLQKAPDATAADIQRIRAIERAGKLRMQIGGALMIGGGAVLTVGIVRAMLQRREPSTEKPMIDVVPEKGGASVTFTVGF